MTKLNCILVLFIISASYLFSQSEGSEIIKVDTVIRVDTVTIIRVDTLVIENLISEPKENNLDHIATNSSTDDTFTPKREKLGLLLLETGVAFSTIPDRQIVSLAVRAPVSRYFHILLKHGRAFDTYRYYSIMVGYSFFIKRSIIDISVGPALPIAGGQIAFSFDEALYSVMDIAYYYRVSKDVVFSATVGGGYRLISSLSLGLGYTL
jgi:hypothetical protein